MTFRLEPFDLDRAIAGEPLVYRSGEEATGFHFFQDAARGYKCIGVVIEFKGIKYLHSYTLEEAEYYLQMKAPLTPLPFDPAKLAEGWIVKTRNGDEVSQITVFKTSEVYTVYGVVDGKIENWTLEGRYRCGHPVSDNPYDLFMYPPGTQE